MSAMNLQRKREASGRWSEHDIIRNEDDNRTKKSKEVMPF